MRTLETIRESFQTRYRIVRCCQYLVHSDNFEIAFRNATEEEKRELFLAIDRNDKHFIRKFIDVQITKLTPFDKLGIKKLREIGQNLSIPNWWDLSKIELIEEIKNVIQRLKETSKRIGIQSKETYSNAENSS